MKKYRIILLVLSIIMISETVMFKNLQSKNNLAINEMKKVKNSEYRKKEFDIDTVEEFSDIFKVKEMNKVNENVYLCYNVEGSLKKCFEGLDYYIKKGYKIEDVKLNFIDENYVNGRMKMSF